MIPWTSYSTDDVMSTSEGSVNAEYQNSKPDLLCTMYKQQLEHIATYNDRAASVMANAGNLDDPKIQAALREFASYTIEELYEAIGELKNKPWKKTFIPTNRKHFREEVADMFHFFLEFLIIAGISPEQLFREYFKKTQINLERQENGY